MASGTLAEAFCASIDKLVRKIIIIINAAVSDSVLFEELRDSDNISRKVYAVEVTECRSLTDADGD